MYKIAIILTTFIRDNLLIQTLQTVVDNFPEDCILLVVDQGYHSEDKNIMYDYVKSQIPLEIYYMPFDSGLSAGRNFLVNRAKELDIPYCLLGADSIQFTEHYDFVNIIKFLESDENHALVGFELEGSKCPWEFNYTLEKDGFHFIESNEFAEFDGQTFKKIEICRNIFLAKTNILFTSPWRDELKLSEHEVFFNDLKEKSYNCFWTDSIKFKRHSTKNEEYMSYRDRFGYYQQKMMQILNITGWIHKPKTKKNEKK